MEVLNLNNVDVGDTVFIYENRKKVFPISRKQSFSYTSSDSFLLLEIFDKVIGGNDKKPVVLKFSKIQDLKTGHIFETRLSSLSLKPNDINKANIIVGISLFLFPILFGYLFFIVQLILTHFNFNLGI